MGEAEYIKLREFFDAALRRAKAEVWREASRKFGLWIGDSDLPDDPEVDSHETFEGYCDARAARIDDGEST